MLEELHATLQAFAAVSGLQIQPAKSHLLLLNARCSMGVFAGFPVVSPGDTVRYLGIWIGLGDLSDINWNIRLRKVKTQLGVAVQYVTSIPDRVKVLNAVALPSLLFTATYYTPSSGVIKEVDQLWKQYLWQGTVSGRPLRAHKVALSIITHTADELGLGLHDPHRAMTTQAARGVLEWNAKRHDKAWSAMHTLLCTALKKDQGSQLHVYPTATARNVHQRVTGVTDMNAIGWMIALQTMRERYPLVNHLRDRRQACIQLLSEAAPCVRWLTNRLGQFCIPPQLREQWTDVTRRNYAAMAPELRSFWLTFPWADNAWIVNDFGHALSIDDFPRVATRLIREARLTYCGDGIFRFHNPCSNTVPRIAHLESIARWVWILIVNTGLHPEDPATWGESSRVYSASPNSTFNRYEWMFHSPTAITGVSLQQKWSTYSHQRPVDRIKARVGSWGEPVVFESATGTAQVMTDFLRLQTMADGATVLSAHPGIQHGPLLVASSQPVRRPLGRQELKRALRLPTELLQQLNRTAAELVIGRLQRTRNDHEGIFGPLQSSSIRQFTSTHPSLSVYQQLFRYRLVLGALNPRDSAGKVMPCPHAFCATALEKAPLSHIVWECVAAKSVWTHTLERWTQRPIPALDEFAYACFRPEAPVLARTTRQALAGAGLDWETQQAVTEQLWTAVTTVSMHQLWLARNTVSFRDRTYTQPGLDAHVWAVFVGQGRSLEQKYRGDASTTQLSVAIKTILDALELASTTEAAWVREIRLYYDGGARGNPGRSGAGSIIISRGHNTPWRIDWWKATYCGSSQTNNFAEHVGLAVGVEECARRYATLPQHVIIIGDSALVTNQMYGRAAVKTQKLRAPMARTQTALAELFSYECFHTRRAGNKMADLLANVAMDTATTSFSGDAATATETTRQLYTMLQGDIDHPHSNLRPQPQLEMAMRIKYPMREDGTSTDQEPASKRLKTRL